MKVFLGVDHGIDGGLAALNESGEIMEAIKMPTKIINGERSIDAFQIYSWLHQNLDEYEFETLAVGEKLHAIFKAAASSTFNFGKNVGTVTGIIEAFEMEYKEVRAVEWQKYIFTSLNIEETHQTKKTPSGKLKRDTKKMALAAASTIWGAEILPYAKQDGVIDALLIAEYARRTH